MTFFTSVSPSQDEFCNVHATIEVVFVKKIDGPSSNE